MLVRLSIIIIIRHLGFIFKKIALELVSKSEEGVGYRYFFFLDYKGVGLCLILNCLITCP